MNVYEIKTMAERLDGNTYPGRGIVLGVTADMLLCDEIRTGYKIKSSMITEKIEKLSPSDRDKIIQMLDIMLGEK